MSDGDPSLEEYSPQDAFSPTERRAFLGRVPSLIGSPLHVIYSFNDASRQATASFIREAKSCDPSSASTSKNGTMKSYQEPSTLCMSAEQTSIDMNTERDNESIASTRLADEPTCNAFSLELENAPTYSMDAESIPLTPPRIPAAGTVRNPSLMFRDGVRTIDFILVWESGKESCSRIDGIKRSVFEKGLRQEGLHIEREPPQGGLNFIKIHAPQSVLKRYTEILKLRMPMKEDLCRIERGSRTNAILNATLYLSQKLPNLKKVHTKTNSLLDGIENCYKRMMRKIRVDSRVFPEKGHRFTAVYSRDKEYLFDLGAPGFWSGAVCSRIVQFILDRQRFSMDRNEDFAFGIERLIAENVYTAAYPLHDGDFRIPGSMRNLLYTEWASMSKCLRYQPLDYVKDYFGVKIALYFAWLGYYTYMLFPAAIVGLLCFIYSLATLYYNEPSEDVCNDNSTIKMCPLCDYRCDYWNLNETCLHSRVTYLFDNPTTVFFAIFMSFWAALFLELWKRYSAEITHRWDLTGFDVHEEHPRPQYLARLAHVKRKQVNVVTNTLEPHVPFWRMRLPATIFSFSIVLLLVTLALATVLAVVLYRMSVLATLSVQNESVITSYAILFTTITAASINLCLICIFNLFYTWIAEKLTEQELLRTQTEFDDSLTLKIYLLQFVNYYASIFYIAFFKGKFVGRPGDYSRLFGYRQEECGPGGCLMELCIQLAIIMIGKQAINTIIEMTLPIIYRWMNILRARKSTNKESIRSSLQWVKDFKLVEWGPSGLFGEYLEMVLQYGFVTIFVAAFPLAPLFALLNNILEMRLDATKLIRLHRRPVPQRVRDIGVWYRILDSIGKLSVITNGFIIAFTSEFVPRLVYRFNHSTDGTLRGYLNNSLAYFNTSHFEAQSRPQPSDYDLMLCRYPDYRSGPWGEAKYEYTSTYYHILAARLAFIVIFENFVAIVMIAVKWIIPDMPAELKDRIRRETYVINEIIINRERHRSGLLSPSATLRNVGDIAGTELSDWNRVLSHSMTGSEFDLAAHSSSADRENRPENV